MHQLLDHYSCRLPWPIFIYHKGYIGGHSVSTALALISRQGIGCLSHPRPKCGMSAILTAAGLWKLQHSSHLQLQHLFPHPRLPRTQQEKHAGYQFYVKIQTENDCIWIQFLWVICCENIAAGFIRMCVFSNVHASHRGLWGRKAQQSTAQRQQQENGWCKVTFLPLRSCSVI